MKRFVATGGLPHHSPLFLQICANVLGEAITVPETEQGPAVGAAILGALAAGAFPDANAAIRAMAQAGAARVVAPDPVAARACDRLYSDYRALTQEFART